MAFFFGKLLIKSEYYIDFTPAPVVDFYLNYKYQCMVVVDGYILMCIRVVHKGKWTYELLELMVWYI